MSKFTQSTHVLAPMQRVTLEFLKNFIAEHGYAPTLKEIAQHIGVRSASTAHFHLERLVRKGFVSRGSNGELHLHLMQNGTTNQRYNQKVKEFKPGNAKTPSASSQETRLPHSESTYGVDNSAEDTFRESVSDWSANHVPLLGVIAAGVPLEAIEDARDIEIPSSMSLGYGKVFCLEVSGESMIEAHICDGDIVVVKRQDYAQNGDIVVALLEDGSATLKTFRRLKSGKVMLIPANAKMQPITLDQITIQGKLIGVMREYR
jgi:repressor LexA